MKIVGTNERPLDASHEGLRLCLHWLDECKKMGWHEDQMNDLEKMFWKFRDKDGKLKSKNP